MAHVVTKGGQLDLRAALRLKNKSMTLGDDKLRVLLTPSCRFKSESMHILSLRADPPVAVRQVGLLKAVTVAYCSLISFLYGKMIS